MNLELDKFLLHAKSIPCLILRLTGDVDMLHSWELLYVENKVRVHDFVLVLSKKNTHICNRMTMEKVEVELVHFHFMKH